ncbi:MAG: hypothetical protein HOH58_08320 [Opitutaceae bacterium]|jgi:hypothetical protein|nr:hypothetical protein [Opitutaceae bacterium]
MKICSTLLISTIILGGLTGCGGSDATTESEAADQSKKTTAVESMPDRPKTSDDVVEVMKEAVMKEMKISEIQLPDLAAVSSDALGHLSLGALSSFSAAGGSDSAGMMSQLTGLKTSLSSGDAIDTLNQLKGWAAAAQQIPGAAAGVEATKAMVSAWALKQGFDAAIIAPVLGALQTGDLGQLAAQGVKLAGVAELSDQQVQILNGVLSNYGIDAKAGEVLNSVKGLFGR